ncbi:MAG: tryptophan-rich sensory protein [Candidatus Harrisonbacteria bacterium]|nr:tryptophan-rich sensory protein [Candidatus Harrisonbacteria bacterium]
MRTYQEFYQNIQKPFFSPPERVFGLAWGIIYPLIAAAGIYLIYLVYRKEAPKNLLWIFLANLAANLLFTPIQLGLRPLWPASIDILIILGTLAFFEYRIWQYSKLIFVLLLPYLFWGAFATVLQLAIFFLNF